MFQNPNKIIRNLGVAGIIGVTLFSTFTSLTTFADVAIKIDNSKNYDQQSKRDWYLLEIPAGQSVNTAVSIVNGDNEARNVQVLARDAEITADGSYTVIDNQLTNTKAGSWFNLAQNELNLNPLENKNLPFEVKVPNGTSSGEYGAGISLMNLSDPGQPNGNVTIKTRKAVRAFVAVPGDYKLAAEVTGLNIIDPNDANYQIIRDQRGSVGKENTSFTFDIKNTGNIFGVMEGKYTLTFPDGTTSDGSFSREFAPREAAVKYFFETNKPYQEGETKVKVDYTIKPLNLPVSKVKVEGASGSLNDTAKLSADDLNKFVASRASTRPAPTASQAATNQPSSISADPNITQNNAFKPSLEQILLSVAVLLLVVILLIQIFKKFKSKNEPKKPDTSTYGS